MSAQWLITGALAIPLIGAALIACLHRLPNAREAATLSTAGALLLCVVALTPEVLAGGRPLLSLLEIMPGLELRFEVEPLGMLFALIAAALWIVNSIYSIGYMRANGEQHQTRFYVCFAGAIASTIGIAFAGNLLTLFVFYEVLTLITYPLVTHAGTPEARRSGRIYLGVLVGTSVTLLLFAIAWTYVLAGTLDFQPGGILTGRTGEGLMAVLLALYVFGIGKAAVMPMHRWLPAAMVAPTPVSALLHAVAVVKAGVFCVVKVMVYILGIDNLAALGSATWLPFVAGFTILAASVVALRSDNLKRRLAYSTVSQLSYVVLATALLAPLSVLGATVHIAAHAVSKITLFFAAGAVYTAAHKTEVSQLDGIGRRMPVTMISFTIGALSLIGVPPAIGFLSKWFMLQGAVQSGAYLSLGVILISTLLNAAYFLPIVYAAFFRATSDDGTHGDHGEAPWPMVLALGLTASATIALFFFVDPILELARQVAMST
ncbi:MAG: monovalent cation/H+ antiporter subunit D family protein [Pseudomonadales bacterium]|nr:monovalent cation/H+ antiporter subunit D family protein [Pseudomonadales bacterium]